MPNNNPNPHDDIEVEDALAICAVYEISPPILGRIIQIDLNAATISLNKVRNNLRVLTERADDGSSLDHAVEEALASLALVHALLQDVVRNAKDNEPAPFQDVGHELPPPNPTRRRTQPPPRNSPQ